jgi:hypothetical protein
MHPDVLRFLAAQHTRDLREQAANRRRSKTAGPRKFHTSSTTARPRIFALRRAADRSAAPAILPATTTGPKPTPTEISVPATPTVQNRHDQTERNAS